MRVNNAMSWIQSKARTLIVAIALLGSAIWVLAGNQDSSSTIEKTRSLEPQLHVEIEALTRVQVRDYRIELDSPELEFLAQFIESGTVLPSQTADLKPGYSIETLTEALARAEAKKRTMSESIATLKGHIQTIQRYLDHTNPDAMLANFRISEMKQWDLRRYIDEEEAANYEKHVLLITRNYSEMAVRWPSLNLRALEFLLTDVKSDLQSVVDNIQSQVRLIESQLPAAIDALATQRRLYDEKHSYFEILALAENRSLLNANLSAIGLVKVNTDDGRHVDIEVEVVDMKETVVIPAGGSKQVRYKSALLAGLEEEKRQVINALWNEQHQARLINLDNHLRVYTSVPTSFSDQSHREKALEHLKQVRVETNDYL